MNVDLFRLKQLGKQYVDNRRDNNNNNNHLYSAFSAVVQSAGHLLLPLLS